MLGATRRGGRRSWADHLAPRCAQDYTTDGICARSVRRPGAVRRPTVSPAAGAARGNGWLSRSCT